MKVIIIGCGRMGIELAQQLNKQNHDIIMIDSDPAAFIKLGDSLDITRKVGVGFDREVLESVGIDRVDALVACTSSDESNAVIARVARNVYRVPQVIARLYDPQKATIYDMLGIQTISTTDWGIRRAMKLLEYSQMDSVLSIGNSDIEIVKVTVPELMVGKNIQNINSADVRVVSIQRNNKAIIPSSGALLERNDILYIAVEHSAVTRLHTVLGL